MKQSRREFDIADIELVAGEAGVVVAAETDLADITPLLAKDGVGAVGLRGVSSWRTWRLLLAKEGEGGPRGSLGAAYLEAAAGKGILVRSTCGGSRYGELRGCR